MPRVPEIEETFEDITDVISTRRATRNAIERGVPKSDVAESIVAFAKERLIAGDIQNANAYIWNAVHDGVAPHLLFFEIEQLTRRNG